MKIQFPSTRLVRGSLSLIGIFWLAILISGGMCVAGQSEIGSREISMDAQWRFNRGDVSDASSREFDDRDWQTVDVPHDWAISGPFVEDAPASREGAFLPSGVAWYRKHLSISNQFIAKKVFIEFDGVMANSDVWINGHHLGHRPNGYVSFRYELTDHLKFGANEDNVIAVRSDTAKQVASRWYTGSGIYRHVRLVVVDPVHVAYDGVYVTTPEITSAHATVDVEVRVENRSDEKQDVKLSTTIVDPDGTVVAEGNAACEVESGASGLVNVDSVVANPVLWNLKSPKLYSVIVRLIVDGESRDQVSTPFGIRRGEFRSDTGFSLNGERIKIKGVCLHHCAGALGAAVPVSAWEHRLCRLRELGVNAVRTAHNPVAPEFLDLCDRMGILVMDEFFDCWTIGKRREDYHHHFREWAHRDMADTLRRDRNHPSVILYSVGNEIHDTPREELAKNILKDLVAICHEIDPTRPVTQGLFRPNVSHDYDNGLADMLDVIGTNYRDLELLQAWRDQPGRKIIGTEQGHDRKIWLACRDNAQHAGQFLWVGIDYLGESWQWPVTTYNSGLLDRTLRPYARGRERQSWWSETPMVRVFRRIAPTEETPTDPGYEDIQWKRQQVLFDDWSPRATDAHEENVEVYSNCDEVELILNDRSLGVQMLPSDASARNWSIPFEAGRLIAIGRNDGVEVARDELATAGAAARIELRVNRSTLAPGFDEVAYVEATVTDSSGVRVPRSESEIAFQVDGPGKLIAVDSASIVSHEPFHASRRRAFRGRCIGIVRATDSKGVLSVTASAEGLMPGVARVDVSPE